MTGQTKPKRAPHTRFFCHLNPTPATPPNEHGRTTTHLPNESRERQQVETTTQAPDEPHTRFGGCGILLNPHPPTEATTPPNENTQPRVRGSPNGEARETTSPVPHTRPSGC
ncbi:hypothetical protein BS47DRAFT_1364090 [Hydnum rufescens UP504]|uniref:Uncharacterized protein n=1 Tax=Hydnum rufescens UP504 TaxID=1448309 RepID=A0A9P6AS29_9AGAM|nr:hypothetical protein BS47DRAFT_1364090 [Hydnum rufescens UP504]